MSLTLKRRTAPPNSGPPRLKARTKEEPEPSVSHNAPCGDIEKKKNEVAPGERGQGIVCDVPSPARRSPRFKCPSLETAEAVLAEDEQSGRRHRRRKKGGVKKNPTSNNVRDIIRIQDEEEEEKEEEAPPPQKASGSNIPQTIRFEEPLEVALMVRPRTVKQKLEALDRELESKSRQHNLTSTNVRNIIHDEEEEEKEEEAPPPQEASGSNIPQTIRFEDPLDVVLTVRPRTVKQKLEALRRHRRQLESQGGAPVLQGGAPMHQGRPCTLILTLAQKAQLQQQVQQHVQLLTEVHMLTSPEEALQSEAATSLLFLSELESFAERGERARGATEPGFISVFRACNLRGALSLLQEIELSAEPPLPNHCSAGGRSPPLLPPQLAWLLATRPVFMYPELLPYRSLDPALLPPRTNAFYTPGEDGLIVLGLRNFSETRSPYELVCRYLIRAKGPVQVRKHVLDMSRRCHPSVVKVYIEQKIVPPMLLACQKVNPGEQRPPVEREGTTMPMWLWKSIRHIHEAVMDYNHFLPESLPPPAKPSHTFPPNTRYPPTLPPVLALDSSGFGRRRLDSAEAACAPLPDPRLSEALSKMVPIQPAPLPLPSQALQVLAVPAGGAFCLPEALSVAGVPAVVSGGAKEAGQSGVVRPDLSLLSEPGADHCSRFRDVLDKMIPIKPALHPAVPRDTLHLPRPRRCPAQALQVSAVPAGGALCVPEGQAVASGGAEEAGQSEGVRRGVPPAAGINVSAPLAAAVVRPAPSPKGFAGFLEKFHRPLLPAPVRRDPPENTCAFFYVVNVHASGDPQESTAEIPTRGLPTSSKIGTVEQEWAAVHLPPIYKGEGGEGEEGERAEKYTNQGDFGDPLLAPSEDSGIPASRPHTLVKMEAEESGGEGWSGLSTSTPQHSPLRMPEREGLDNIAIKEEEVMLPVTEQSVLSVPKMQENMEKLSMPASEGRESETGATDDGDSPNSLASPPLSSCPQNPEERAGTHDGSGRCLRSSVSRIGRQELDDGDARRPLLAGDDDDATSSDPLRESKDMDFARVYLLWLRNASFNANAGAESGTHALSDANKDSETRPFSNANAKRELETRPFSNANAKSETCSFSNANAKSETCPFSNANAKSETCPFSNANAKSETCSFSNANAKSETCSLSDANVNVAESGPFYTARSTVQHSCSMAAAQLPQVAKRAS